MAQTALPTEQPASAQVTVPTKQKRTFDPESIKRAKLTRLRKDVALTDDQAAKAKPIIDAYVDETRAIKSDASLDSRTKRQRLSEARQHFDSELEIVLNPEQQRKLASLREERRARLRAARASKEEGSPEVSGAPVAPAAVQ